MADNTTLPGTGDVIAADDVGGVKYQQVKLVDGTLDSATPTGTNANPLKTASPDNQSLRSVTLTTAGTDSSVDCTGYGAVQWQLGGVWSGAAVFEVSNDGSANSWMPQLCLDVSTSLPLDSVTGPGIYQVVPAGKFVRVNVKQINGSMAVLALGKQRPTTFSMDAIALAMDQQNNTPLNVRVNNLLQDSQGALRFSDADKVLTVPVIGTPTAGTILALIDTTGYQSIYISSSAIVGLTVIGATSNTLESGSFVPVGGYAQANGTVITQSQGGTTSGLAFNLNANVTGHVYPVQGKYFRLTAVSGSGPTVLTIALRTTPPPNVFNQQVNLATIGYVAGNSPGNVGVPILGQAKANTTLVTRSDLTTYWPTLTDMAALVVEKHAWPQLWWNYAAPASGLVNTTTAVTIKAAVAGQRGNISSIQIQHEPLGAATEFAIRDGAAGTVLWRIKLPQTTAEGPMNFAFDPPLRQAAVNTLLEIVTLTASVTGAVYFNAQGFMSN